MQPCINVVRILELGNCFVAACRLECENNIDVTFSTLVHSCVVYSYFMLHRIPAIHPLIKG